MKADMADGSAVVETRSTVHCRTPSVVTLISRNLGFSRSPERRFELLRYGLGFGFIFDQSDGSHRGDRA